MDKKWGYWVVVYLIAAIIFYYSSLSYPLGKPGIGLSSWIWHVVEYGVFSIAVYFAFKNDNRFVNKKLNMLLFVLLFAISDEIHQYFVPGRIASMGDIGIDLVGSLVALLFIIT